jgi:hypothetical protein
VKFDNRIDSHSSMKGKYKLEIEILVRGESTWNIGYTD